LALGERKVDDKSNEIIVIPAILGQQHNAYCFLVIRRRLDKSSLAVDGENRTLYYKALRRTQTTLKTDMPDWEPWLGFFLRCLKKQKDNLAAKVEYERACSDTTLPTLSVHILRLLSAYERLTISEMVGHTGANQNTLKVRLRDLVEAGRIQRHGKARATWYSLL
jgi:hypothetical protein